MKSNLILNQQEIIIQMLLDTIAYPPEESNEINFGKLFGSLKNILYINSNKN